MGKTALLTRFAAKKAGVYYLAYLDSAELLLRNLSADLWHAEHGPDSIPGSYGSWLGLFQAVGRLAAQERFVLVLDEYPYLADADGHVASVLQKVWDERLQHSQLFLVLCGSYLSVMERDVLNRDAPLYGRRTAQLSLRPLTVRQVKAFLPQASAVEIIQVFAVTGGMPAYLAQFHSDRSLWTNLSQTAFDPSHILYNDGLTLLRRIRAGQRAFSRGERQYLWDEGGRKYTDLLGMNVCISVGHAHPVVNAAVWRCAACSCNSRTSCCWTNPPTTWTPRAWPGWSTTCSATRER